MRIFSCIVFACVLSTIFPHGDVHADYVWFSGDTGGQPNRLGIQVLDLTVELREFFGAPKDAGILVSQVEEKGPADLAGVKVGDVIVEIIGRRADKADEVGFMTRTHRQGEQVELVLIRQKKRLTVRATMQDEATEDRPFSQFSIQSRRRHDTSAPNNDEIEILRKRIDTLEKRLRSLESARD